ncbi:MAG: pyruvate kinase, partial [Treponema sp.]
LIPALRVVDGVVAESGCDIPAESLVLVNPDLVWICNVPDAQKELENDLSVTLDCEQGVVYEGIV